MLRDFQFLKTTFSDFPICYASVEKLKKTKTKSIPREFKASLGKFRMWCCPFQFSKGWRFPTTSSASAEKLGPCQVLLTHRAWDWAQPGRAVTEQAQSKSIAVHWSCLLKYLAWDISWMLSKTTKKASSPKLSHRRIIISDPGKARATHPEQQDSSLSGLWSWRLLPKYSRWWESLCVQMPLPGTTTSWPQEGAGGHLAWKKLPFPWFTAFWGLCILKANSNKWRKKFNYGSWWRRLWQKAELCLNSPNQSK